MEEYLEAYFEAVQQDQEYNCEYEKEYGDCNCENADDEEICEYDCYMGKGMEYCVDNNPYAEEGEEQEEKKDLKEYAECQNLEIQDNNGRRKLEQEVEYFMGAYWCVKYFTGGFVPIVGSPAKSDLTLFPSRQLRERWPNLPRSLH